MYYQQTFAGLVISAVVIPSNRKLLVQQWVPALLETLGHVQPGQTVAMDLGSNSNTWQSLRLHVIEQKAQHTSHVFKPPGFDSDCYLFAPIAMENEGQSIVFGEILPIIDT